MYETSEIRKGLKVKIDGYPWIVVDFHFVKPGKGTAFTRVRLKNLKTGSVLERTYKTGERLEEANFEDRLAQFQYSDPDNYHFMDQENYEQIAVSAAIVGEGKNFLLENMIVSVLFYEGVPMSLEFPTFIETRITYTEPGVRGDTATGTTLSRLLSQYIGE